MKNLPLIIYTLLLFTLSTCTTDKALLEIKNLNNNLIGVFGHGGTGISYKYPINSFESIDYCLKIGSDGTEMDLQLTKDSVLVVFHEKNLYDATLCSGFVHEKFWTEIWGCHYTSPISSKLNLMSLDDLFLKLENYKNKTYTFDCKLNYYGIGVEAYHKAFANAIIKSISKSSLNINNVFIESNDTSFLSLLQLKAQRLKLFYLPHSFEDGLIIARKMNLFGISISNDRITKEQIALAHKSNIRVTLWNTTTDKANLNALNKSPDYIQTDKINHLLKVFGKYKN